jgi:hypothetical protein
MIPDPTDEIRAIRNRLAAKCNYDLDRIVEETRQHQRDSGRTYCSIGQEATVEETTNLLIDAKYDSLTRAETEKQLTYEPDKRTRG